MALPSQSARPIRIRAGVGSKRRRRKRGGGFIVGLILVGAAGGATWWLWPDSEAPVDGMPIETSDGPSAVTPTVELDLAVAERPEPIIADAVSSSLADGASADVALTVPAPAETPAAETADSAAAAAATTTQPLPPNALETAATLIRANKPVDARTVLSAALRDDTLAPADAEHLRATLATINEGLVFSREIANGDPYVGLYTIKSGDTLSRIVDEQDLPINWRFLQRVNGISSPGRIGVGQRLKTITTPFHAIVHKQDHRLDLWLGEGDDAVYVRSFSVGLGEFDSTPQGLFRVRKGGKLVNPSWRNPRTGEYFEADNPANPIGEFWIGLQGIDAHNLQEQGFGVHGTIEPDSIGGNHSMGCVRLGDADIDLLYGVLASGKSTVLVK